MFKQLKTKGAALIAVPAAMLAVNAHAADVDYSSIIDGIDFSSISTGILALAATLGGVYAVVKGAKIVLSFIRN